MTDGPACKVTMRDKLPPSILEVADLLGDGPLLKLLEAHGGTRLYIPDVARPFDPLATVVGITALRRLVRVYARETIIVPLCKQWRAHMLRADGLTFAAISRRLGMHEQSVYRLLSGADRRSDIEQMRFRFD